MVPGDYNLVLLDELLSNTNVEQIGCTNELNAAYAADGYARVNGCGAVIATFNVGAFSALAGVAGAYAEDLPVIFISGGVNKPTILPRITSYTTRSLPMTSLINKRFSEGLPVRPFAYCMLTMLRR